MFKKNQHQRRVGSPGWKPDATPTPAPVVADDDTWLLRACKVLKGHWVVSPHHKARLEWCASRAIPFWTDGTRKLAWNAVLQYPTLWAELTITPRPMPAHISAADTTMPAHGGVIRADATHFFAVTGDEFAKIALSTVGFRWSRDRSAMAVRIEPLAADGVAKLGAEYGFTLDPAATDAVAAMHTRSADLAKLSGAQSDTFTVEGLAVKPHPYQQAGIRYIVETKRCLIGDEMGLGKTLESLAAVQSLGAWPAIVCTLPVVKDGWRREATKCLPGVEVVVWSGKTDAPVVYPGDGSGRTLHVINYDILTARLDELKALGAKAVIYDEAHKCTNGKAKRTKAAKELGARKAVRIALTGTPCENDAQELLGIIQLIGRVDAFGGFGKFVTRYLGAKKTTYGWDFSGAQNLPELHHTMRQTCYLRRRKNEVQRELPTRIVTRVPIALSAGGLAHYNAARADVKSWIASKAPLKPEFLRSIAHLALDLQEFEKAKEFAAAVDRMDGMELLHRFGVLRRAVLDAKLAAGVEWLLHHCEGAKMVLFGHHKTGLRELLPRLGPLMPLLIDGEVPTHKRTAIVEQFRRPEHRLLLANFDAAGTGLDGLQHSASHCAWFEWPWTNGKREQCISRLERTGQKNAVHVWDHVAEGTIDDDSWALLEEKGAIASAITDGEAIRSAAIDNARKIAKNL